MDLSWLSHSLIEKEPTWQAMEQSLLLENEHILPGIFMKNFVTYKQVTEFLPDPKRALLVSSVLEFRGVLDHRALESQSAWES